MHVPAVLCARNSYKVRPYLQSAIADQTTRAAAPDDTVDMAVASITIRNLDDDVKARIRERAAGNGRSMKEEVRVILRQAVGREEMPKRGLGTAIHDLFKPFGGVELDLPPRGPMREPPSFD